MYGHRRAVPFSDEGRRGRRQRRGQPRRAGQAQPLHERFERTVAFPVGRARQSASPDGRGGV